MNGERWVELKAAFAELSELGPEERAQRVASVEATDPWLASRLEALLAADDASDSSLHPLTSFAAHDPEVRATAGDATAPPKDPFGLAGRTVSHFRVESVLGSGGMGVLYRAEDLRLGRTVALKFLLPQYSVDASARERFLAEARAASALDHPNVCTVYEAGESEDGQLFMAMRCYDGETLKARIASAGPLPVAEVVEIARQVLLGLGAAHAAGIVHRDLKPGNLMLVPGAPLKILDFGLAKMHDLNLSNPELRPGTVAYMSPEQLEGRPVDARTDLWSLGVVLYEMLTGRTPFGSGPDLGTVHAILVNEPAPPSTLREGIPAGLDGITDKLLLKPQDERYASADDVLADLETAFDARARVQPPRRRRLSARQPAAMGLFTVVAAIGVVVAVGIRGRVVSGSSGEGAVASGVLAARSPAAGQASIAILPFTDLSPERDQQYFSDGVTEEVIHRLSSVEGLTVAASTSSFQFKDRSTDAREVGSRLGVAYLLEGGARRAGDQLRITVRLVSTETGYPLWSQTYERRVDDVLEVQEEISRSIVEALRLQLASTSNPRAGSTGTESVDAYELFLRGRFFANRRTEDALATAAGYFRQAIDIDPGFARAYAGLAETYVAPRRAAPAVRFEQGRAAALQALALDSTLAEAHTAMTWINMWYDRDWSAAEAHFQRALASNPNYIWAHQWYSAFLAATGRPDEALVAIQTAHLIDPLSVATLIHVGTVLFWLGRYEEASTQYGRALELDPGFFMGHWGVARAALLLGRPEEAIRELQPPGTDYVGFFQPALLGHAYATAGRETEARGILADLHARRDAGEYVAPTEFASIHIGLGELDVALDWLELHEADRGARIFLKADPMFDPVRSTARFQQLLTRLGLD